VEFQAQALYFRYAILQRFVFGYRCGAMNCPSHLLANISHRILAVLWSGATKRLEIVREILGGNKPLIVVVLRIARDHVAELWRARLPILSRDAYAIMQSKFVTPGWIIRAKFCDLLAAVLLKFRHAVFLWCAVRSRSPMHKNLVNQVLELALQDNLTVDSLNYVKRFM
jgi:hypothetical protein